MDLPGIYSLSPYTLEEVVARNYLIGERPDAIINIIDGTNIERNLYLSTQIMELGIPVVMAVNMMDLVKKSGMLLTLISSARNSAVKWLRFQPLKAPASWKQQTRLLRFQVRKQKHLFMNCSKC